MTTGGGGAIINVASSAGLRYHPGITAYSASKGGVIALTYAMAGEHARDKIRVNCIAPGLAYTSMVADSMDEETRTVRRLAGPLGTEGTAWDIAWTAVYLASDEARWVTGAVIPVDAGLTIATPGSYQPTNMYRRLSRQG
jgi:NAD(P)-dependent dehydrogenase (short-subunit alcohol dehydrogenase family)